MAVSSDTAQSLIKELHLMSRATRAALIQPEEGQLLPGAVWVLGTAETKGSCRQVDLVADLYISPSVLSRHVAELVGAGYLSRHADPTDGRATLIQVTAAGHDLLRRIGESRARILQTVLADWSEDEAAQAYTAVQKLRNSLAAHAYGATTSQHHAVLVESE